MKYRAQSNGVMRPTCIVLCAATLAASVLLLGCRGTACRSSSAPYLDNMEPLPTKIRFLNKSRKPITIKPKDSLVLTVSYDDDEGNSVTKRHGDSGDTNKPTLSILDPTTIPGAPPNQMGVTIENGDSLSLVEHEILACDCYGTDPTNFKTLEIQVGVLVIVSELMTVPLDAVLKFAEGVQGDFTGNIVVIVGDSTTGGSGYTIDCYAQFELDLMSTKYWAHVKAENG